MCGPSILATGWFGAAFHGVRAGIVREDRTFGCGCLPRGSKYGQKGAPKMSSDADHDVCGMSLAIDVVGGKWKLHLMWVLDAGPQRFGQIRRLLDGVSEKVLAENLRHLESSGVVHREIFPEIPRAWSTRSPRSARPCASPWHRSKAGATSTARCSPPLPDPPPRRLRPPRSRCNYPRFIVLRARALSFQVLHGDSLADPFE